MIVAASHFSKNSLISGNFFGLLYNNIGYWNKWRSLGKSYFPVQWQIPNRLGRPIPW